MKSLNSKPQPRGTKRLMWICGLCLIGIWLLIGYTVNYFDINAGSYQLGRLGVIGIVGIGLTILPFFIKEKSKKGNS